MKRVLLRASLALGVLVLAVVVGAGGLLLWAARSESGLRFVWQRVAPRLPQGISVAAVEGRLAGPLVLAGVTVQTDALEVRVDRVELRWQPRALVRRVVHIERLDVRGVDVVRLPAGEPAAPSEPFRLPESVELPVDVQIAGASVETLRFRFSPSAEPLSIERVSVAGSFDANALELRELAVRGPAFDVQGAARVVPRGAYATSGQLDWAVRLGAYPEARGSTRVSGDLELLEIEQRVEPPYDARVDLRVHDALAALRLDGEVALTVQPAALGAEQVPAESVGATLELRGTPRALEVAGRVELTGGEAGGAAADFALQYAGGDAVEIRSLAVQDARSSAALQASGRVAVGGEQPVLELDATWAQLQWPLRGKPQVASESGSLRLNGTPHDYAIALDGSLALADGTNGQVRVSGAGNAEALALDRVDIEALRGRIAGRMNVRWAPSLSGAVELTGTALDPGVVLPDWPGQVDARVHAQAALEGERLTVELHALEADGRLRDRPLELRARGGYAASALRIDALALRSGATDVTARGTAGNELALEWQVESPALEEVWPELQGALSARGALRGPRERPHVSVEARGQALRFMGSAAEDLELAADVDVAGEAPSSLALNVSDASVADVAIAELRFTGEGNAARHALAVSATTSAGDARFELSGAVDAPWQPKFAWTFALDEATLAHPVLAPWALRAPALGSLTRTDASLARSCWQSGTAELCLEGTRGAAGTRAAFALSPLPFDYFAALLATPARLEGDVSAEGTFEQSPDGTPQFEVLLRTSPGRLVSADARDADEGGEAVERYALAFGPADGRLGMQEDRIEATLRLPFAEQGELAASARIGTGAGAPFGERALEGELKLDIAALDFVSELLPQAQNTQGVVTGDLRVGGTVGTPQLAGSLMLAGGKATFPGTNVELEGVELALAGDGANGLTVDGQAQSGGGTLRAEGRVTFVEAGPAGRIAIDGDAFEVVDTVDAQIAVSPDLDVTLTRDSMAVTGSVLVPRARLTPKDTGESAVAVSGDEVIVEPGDESAARNRRPFSANVRLVLGDDVRIDGYGLTGRLGGAIEITETPGEPTAATGELRVEEGGVYEAYGQQLAIETGRVVFAGGPVADPGVDIEAVRRPVEGIVVGARVRGLLAAPELSLFSEPPMAQQEQLSYLVLGRPLDDASQSESSAMSRAALALGVKGGNFVSERINENLGLDAFGIESGSDETAAEAAFVIGKYLTPSLYVSYGIGIFESVNTLKLRYAFAPRWRLETETSSNASGGDLIYNIERGR
jgi:translocation and assembly module TamB